MGSFSIWHWLIVGLVILLLFGKGRMSDLMGDLAKGIKSFKKGMADDDAPAMPQPPREVTVQPAQAPATAATQTTTTTEPRA